MEEKGLDIIQKREEYIASKQTEDCILCISALSKTGVVKRLD